MWKRRSGLCIAAHLTSIGISLDQMCQFCALRNCASMGKAMLTVKMSISTPKHTLFLEFGLLHSSRGNKIRNERNGENVYIVLLSL